MAYHKVPDEEPEGEPEEALQVTQTRQKLPIKKKLVPQSRRSASSVVASSSTPDLSTTSIIDILQEQATSTQQSQTQIPGPLPESQFIAVVFLLKPLTPTGASQIQRYTVPCQSGNVRAGKQRPEGNGLAPASPVLDCTLSKDADLVPVLPWTAVESTLHLQPNSILLLSVFAFYYEAFVGMEPLVALLHHFFNLRLHDDAHLWACVSFVVAQSGNMLLKSEKKVENFRHRWVLMCLKDANPRQEKPNGLPGKTSAWISANLSDPRVVPVMERFSLTSAPRGLSGE
ncbi:hypothetical protein D1007_51406 [Hordeum vulgare]|nr:hypothetical protein D1007_51406 [Hordeum vulgare]